jgi:CDK-activating kinase assembly factor MAT1
MKVFNKVESDFSSLEEYNNYLEEVEDIIYSIVNEEPNAEDMKNKVKAYEEANKSLIVIRQSQRADEERSIADRIAEEQRDAERRKQEVQEEEKAIALAKRKLKQESTEVLLGVSLKSEQRFLFNLVVVDLCQRISVRDCMLISLFFPADNIGT